MMLCRNITSATQITRQGVAANVAIVCLRRHATNTCCLIAQYAAAGRLDRWTGGRRGAVLKPGAVRKNKNAVAGCRGNAGYSGLCGREPFHHFFHAAQAASWGWHRSAGASALDCGASCSCNRWFPHIVKHGSTLLAQQCRTTLTDELESLRAAAGKPGIRERENGPADQWGPPRKRRQVADLIA